MKFTIKARLFVTFGILVAALVALGAFSIFAVRSVNDQAVTINTKWLPGVDLANALYSNAGDFRRNEIAAVLLSDPSDKNSQVKEMESIKETFLDNFDKYGGTIATDEERRLYATIKTHWDQYLIEHEKILALDGQEKDAEAIDLIFGSARDVFRSLTGDIEQLVKFNQDQSNLASEKVDQIYGSTVNLLVAIIVIATLLAIGSALLITRSILRPIASLTKSADTIASGNLNVDIDVSSKDEIGKLAVSFKAMVDNVNEILTNINSAADQVASSSRQASELSMALSQGATEQASSIEQLTASMDEISTQTKQNAGYANEAMNIAVAAREDAIEGNSQMQGMLKAMEDINEASGSISKIIKVIDEIAFQTNILALNAAVEAARAGQHGKGFAVVAEEVRNLAARSANAAKETTDMIEGSIKKAEGGTKIANETAAALNKIVGGVTKVAELVEQIDTASNEQATAIVQVNQGITQVSQVVQTNSATSEEAAAASEELSGQAEMLKEQVGRFTLKKTNGAYRSFDEANPEVVQMLEKMSGRGRTDAEIRLGKAEAAAAKPKIALSDRDFGKY
jgi:methyl-accepting chemotaxis protein